MELFIIVGVAGVVLGFAGGFLYTHMTMESARERGNLSKKISALPYMLLDLMDNPRFRSLSSDDKTEFVASFFRKELKTLNVPVYTTSQIALEQFYKRKHLDRVPGQAVAQH
ncbi:MAG: hypothetical protein PHX83_16620 [Acidobacteriia bacterium]|nr:hypothetical protein [Terriglobia bacterium]